MYSNISLSVSIPNALNNTNNGICFLILGSRTVITFVFLLIFTTVVLAYLNVLAGTDLI